MSDLKGSPFSGGRRRSRRARRHSRKHRRTYRRRHTIKRGGKTAAFIPPVGQN